MGCLLKFLVFSQGTMIAGEISFAYADIVENFTETFILNNVYH